ncbi:MAG: 50S ribosomal protein L9 [Gammaproteobacteria bacterium]
MEVILLEKVENLGGLGDQVKVRPGYGRNYLIPSGKAAPATPENIARFEAQRAELERIAQEKLAAAEKRREAIDGKSVTIKAKSGAEGKLFGSVGTAEIAAAATEACGVEVEKSEVRLPTGPIRLIGEYDIELHLHTDVSARLNVVVEGEE